MYLCRFVQFSIFFFFFSKDFLEIPIGKWIRKNTWRTKVAEKGRLPFWMHNWTTHRNPLAFKAFFFFFLFIWNILWYSLIWLSLIKCGKYSFIYKKKVTTDTKLKRSTRLESKLKKKKATGLQSLCHLQAHTLTAQCQNSAMTTFSGKTNEHLIHSALPNIVTQISTFNQYLWSQTWENNGD